MSHSTKQNNRSADDTVSVMSFIKLTLSQANTCPKPRAISSESIDRVTSKR